MTPKERDAWSIANAAAMMNVSEQEAARRLDEALGPQWREVPIAESVKEEQSGSKALPKKQG